MSARSLALAISCAAALGAPSAIAAGSGAGPTAGPAVIQDIWLHYDYMVGSDGHSDAPDPSAVQAVVDAFAAHGIELHVDPAHAAIPEHQAIDPDFAPGLCPNDGTFTDVVSFLALKAAYFHPRQKHEWHYAIFGSWTPCRATGAANLPGDNLVIAEGRLVYLGQGNADRLRRFTSGTFMHELGHNLGLRHGGGDDIPGKPNYLSVMNYSFQLLTLPYAATPGSTTIAGFRLDYSEEVLPALDEAHLDEMKGVGGGPTDTRITTYDTVFGFGFGAASGPIDWNLDGDTTDTDVAVSLNLTQDCLVWGSSCDNTHVLDRLVGFDDWAEVHAYLAAGEPHLTDGSAVDLPPHG